MVQQAGEDESTRRAALAQLNELKKTQAIGPGTQAEALFNLVFSAIRGDELALNDEDLKEQFGLVTYANKDYWEGRYEEQMNQSYEWYMGWDDLDASNVSRAELSIGGGEVCTLVRIGAKAMSQRYLRVSW